MKGNQRKIAAIALGLLFIGILPGLWIAMGRPGGNNAGSGGWQESHVWAAGNEAATTAHGAAPPLEESAGADVPEEDNETDPARAAFDERFTHFKAFPDEVHEALAAIGLTLTVHDPVPRNDGAEYSAWCVLENGNRYDTLDIWISDDMPEGDSYIYRWNGGLQVLKDNTVVLYTEQQINFVYLSDMRYEDKLLDISFFAADTTVQDVQGDPAGNGYLVHTSHPSQLLYYTWEGELAASVSFEGLNFSGQGYLDITPADYNGTSYELIHTGTRTPEGENYIIADRQTGTARRFFILGQQQGGQTMALLYPSYYQPAYGSRLHSYFGVYAEGRSVKQVVEFSGPPLVFTNPSTGPEGYFYEADWDSLRMVVSKYEPYSEAVLDFSTGTGSSCLYFTEKDAENIWQVWQDPEWSVTEGMLSKNGRYAISYANHGSAGDGRWAYVVLYDAALDSYHYIHHDYIYTSTEFLGDSLLLAMHDNKTAYFFDLPVSGAPRQVNLQVPDEAIWGDETFYDQATGHFVVLSCWPEDPEALENSWGGRGYHYRVDTYDGLGRHLSTVYTDVEASFSGYYPPWPNHGAAGYQNGRLTVEYIPSHYETGEYFPITLTVDIHSLSYTAEPSAES